MEEDLPVVVVATVGGRERECEATVGSWRRVGIDPLVHHQPAGRVPSPRSHVRDMLESLEMGLSVGVGSVVFSEDDLEVSSYAAQRLREIRHLRTVVTLYLPGRRFYPAEVNRAVTRAPYGCYPVMFFREWYGSQCLWFPRHVAEALVMAQPSGGARDGGDVVLREWLRGRGERLFVVTPNVVQHLGERSVTSARFHFHRSATYVP